MIGFHRHLPHSDSNGCCLLLELIYSQEAMLSLLWWESFAMAMWPIVLVSYMYIPILSVSMLFIQPGLSCANAETSTSVHNLSMHVECTTTGRCRRETCTSEASNYMYKFINLPWKKFLLLTLSSGVSFGNDSSGNNSIHDLPLYLGWDSQYIRTYIVCTCTCMYLY